MLEFNAATKRFGPLAALDGCTFAARPGRLTGFLVVLPAPFGPLAGTAAELSQVDELIPHAHPRVQPTLFRHVAEARPVRRRDPRALPLHAAGVELDQTEHGATTVGMSRDCRQTSRH